MDEKTKGTDGNFVPSNPFVVVDVTSVPNQSVVVTTGGSFGSIVADSIYKSRWNYVKYPFNLQFEVNPSVNECF